MHIPGGIISDTVCALTTVASSSVLGLGVWQALRGKSGLRGHAGGPSLAAVGAVVFAAQMVNFPVDHGTSGHLIGGALAAALLGPWGATWTMACVVTTQALLFGDGGCGALGANLLTMAITAPWTAWLAYRGLARLGLTRPDASGGTNGWGREALAWGVAGLVSVFAAATVCSLVLALGGAAPAAEVVPAMLLAHLPVGMVEGLATAAVVLLAAGRVSLPLRSTMAPNRTLLALSAAVAVLLAPLASSAPDGLESVAARLGFLQPAGTGFAGLLPDYALPGVGWAPLAVALAGLVGIAAVSATSYLVGRTAEGVRRSR
ncbi:MAG TPA: energy-coupling factor ABC transporter permease [Pirellulales bacterium]|jgi:cobalt/nickel transport system permease protein|nr:energy-coupling factor ABC transporter permease [Pirellulales bacterium]